MREIKKKIYLIYPALIKYPAMIEFMKEHESTDGLCYITQKSIAAHVGLSQTGVSKYLKKLEKFDNCITQIAPGRYRVNHINMLDYGPVNKIAIYQKKIEEDLDFVSKSFNEQKDILRFNRDTTLFVRHHFISSMNEILEYDENESDIQFISRFRNYCMRYKIIDNDVNEIT